MKYVKLGNTGIKISQVVLGSNQMGWRIDEKTSFEVMDKAVELGINAIDTANIYGKWGENSYPGKSEEIIGNWINERGNREDIVLATKLYGEMSENVNDRGLSRKHIHKALKGSLKRLQTDWLDIYFTHTFDAETPVEETMRTMTSLVEQGKIHYMGASNHPAWRIMEALWVSDKHGLERYEVLQPVYNIAKRHTYEQDLEPLVEKYRLGVTSYSPLGTGFLTGRYEKEKSPETPRAEGVKRRYFKDRNFETLKTLKKIAKEKEISMVQLAISWVVHQESITAPIIGGNSIEQLEENVGALEVKLTKDELKQIDEASDWKTLDELSR
ncbi:MAG: aldo/keto reductase [Candidatus Heimdallarchaeota archaeon]|nr:aldo/keto reductase [Candidatus Heimdallarchaeota archaeon]MCK4290848.1 aldo/keto reductase [Candidatus Heimdallarchaeota archaeon]